LVDFFRQSRLGVLSLGILFDRIFQDTELSSTQLHRKWIMLLYARCNVS